MNLMLNNGIPELNYSETQKISVSINRLNDDIWHHIAVSVPKKDCLLSKIEFYVDGQRRETSLTGSDSNISLPNGGLLALGGLGYGGLGSKEKSSRKGFQIGEPFVGEMDEVSVWARDLKMSEISQLAQRPFDFAIRSKLSYEWKEALCIGLGMFLDSIYLRPCNDEQSQRWVFDSLGYLHNKNMYEKCIVPDASGNKISLEACSLSRQYDFRWKLKSQKFFEYIGGDSSGKVLTIVNEGRGNDIELHPLDGSSSNQLWEIVERDDPSYLTQNPSSMPSVSPTKKPTSTPSYVPTEIPSLSPSMVPSRLPSPSPSDEPSTQPSNSCRDTKGKFVLNNGSTKSCRKAKMKLSLCSIKKVFKKCPLTCGSCTPDYLCRDIEGRFEIGDGKRRNCRAASENPSLCENEIVKGNCCKTCS